MAEKKFGHGIYLSIDDDNNGSYTTVAQVRRVTPGGVMVGEEDATTLDDLLVYYAQFTINEYPPLELEIVWDPSTATHVTLRTLSEARTSFGMRLVYANYTTTKTWQCATGFLQKMQPGEVASKTLQTATLSYRPQAVPTFT
jgi:hypothetical protein